MNTAPKISTTLSITIIRDALIAFHAIASRRIPQDNIALRQYPFLALIIVCLAVALYITVVSSQSPLPCSLQFQLSKSLITPALPCYFFSIVIIL